MLLFKSWREAIFCASYLGKMFRVSSKRVIDNAESIEDLAEQISIRLADLTPEIMREKLNISDNKIHYDELKLALIAKVQQSFLKEEQLPNDAFEWIKKDPRACAFCWCFLQKKTEETLNQDYNINNYDDNHTKQKTPSKYNRKALVDSNRQISLDVFLQDRYQIRLSNIRSRKFQSNNHSQRFDTIQKALQFSEIDLRGQYYILSILLDAWKKTYNNSTNIKLTDWLNSKDTIQVAWLTNYLKAKLDIFQLSWDPITDEERYMTLRADLDYFFLVNPGKAEAFFLKARPAWNQRKHQNKENGTKSRGISMSERTNKRLDWLAKHKDQKINATIKELIDNEFKFSGGPSNL